MKTYAFNDSLQILLKGTEVFDASDTGLTAKVVLDMTSHRIENLANPVHANDAVNLATLNAVAVVARSLTMAGSTPGTSANETVELKAGDTQTLYFDLSARGNKVYRFKILCAARGSSYTEWLTQSFECSVSNTGSSMQSFTVTSGASHYGSVGSNWSFSVDTATSPSRLRIQFSTGQDTKAVTTSALLEWIEVA